VPPGAMEPWQPARPPGQAPGSVGGTRGVGLRSVAARSQRHVLGVALVAAGAGVAVVARLQGKRKASASWNREPGPRAVAGDRPGVQPGRLPGGGAAVLLKKKIGDRADSP